MEMFFLIEFTNTHIFIAILYGLASLLLGIGFGYAINSKYKRQVVELERNKAKLNSSISNLEADIEEGKKARSNANGEISLLRNQLRDRESRLRETEGKVAIFKRKLEEEVKKQSVAVKAPEVKTPEPKKTSFFGSAPVIKPKEVVEKKIETPVSTMKLVKEDLAEKVEPAKPKTKKSKGKKAKSKAKASSSDSKVKLKKKRGRPAGSKNKSTETISQVSDSSTGKKRGRPAGSKNKTAPSASATKEVASAKSTSTAKRGRPAGSKNKATAAKTSPSTAPKRRGRPAGSNNKTSTTSTPKVASTGKRGRPAGSKNKTTSTSTTKVAATAKRGRPAGTKNKAAASVGRKKEDLTLIEGIGPKIQELLRAGGIKTYNKMSKTLPKKMKDILVKNSARYNRVTTDSWPKQAKLAAEGKMEALKKLQDSLDRGK